jgi:hypothetical protein
VFDARERQMISSSFCVQTSSEAYPASYSVGTIGSVAGGKARPWRDTDHSPASSAEVKNELERYSSPRPRLRRIAGKVYFTFT